MDTLQRRDNSAKKLYQSLETDKNSFHPKILRGPKNSPSHSKEPACERLYKLRNNSVDKKERSQHSKGKEKPDRSTEIPKNEKQGRSWEPSYQGIQIKITAKSEAMYEDLVVSKLREIFLKLDANEDGVISAMNIDISGLSPFQLEKFAPLLVEMEDMNQNLDLNDFISSGKILLAVSTTFCS